MTTTPNGDFFICATSAANSKNTLHIYRTTDGKESCPAICLDASVNSIVATDTRILAFSEDTWSTYVCPVIFENDCKPIAIKLAFRKAYACVNSEIIVIETGDSSLRIIDLTKETPLELKGHSMYTHPTNVYFTDDSNIIFRCYRDRSAAFLNIDQKTTCVLPKLSTHLQSIRYSKGSTKFDGRYFFIKKDCGYIDIWDVLNDSLVYSIPGDTIDVSTVSIIQRGDDIFAIAMHLENAGISLWKKGPNHNLICQINEKEYWTEMLMFNKCPNGRYIVSIGNQNYEISQVHPLDYPDTVLIAPDKLPDNWTLIRNVYAVLPDQLLIAAGGYNGILKITNILSGDYYSEKIGTSPIEQIASVPNSSYIAVVFRNGQVCIYDVFCDKLSHSGMRRDTVLNILAVPLMKYIPLCGIKSLPLQLFRYRSKYQSLSAGGQYL